METPTFLTPLTIFIVDDNPVDVYLMRWVLDAHELDYHLRVIDNGNHALAVFDRLAQQEHLRSLTIVLLDLHLPQCDEREDRLGVLVRTQRTVGPQLIRGGKKRPREIL